MTQESDKALEEKAERIGIWWEGHSEGARKQLSKYILNALREVAEDAKREEAAEWEQATNSVKTDPYHASGWSLACDEILRRRGGKP